MVAPPLLKKGDTVAFISPATTVKGEYIDTACALLESRGFRTKVMPSAKGPECGSYASPLENRLDDFISAWKDDDVRCVFCARGGYGCVHLLDLIPGDFLASDPKWLVGFSDVSALHAMLYNAGIMSIHGPMAKHLAIERPDDECTNKLLDIMTCGPSFSYKCPLHSGNVCGIGRGVLRGGNLAVLDGLVNTPFDILDISDGEEVILFIEDIAEPIYKVERMLWRMHLNGTLDRLKGLVVGQFTEYKPDRNWNTMEEMISSRLSYWGIDSIPVAFGFPVGHVSVNCPLVEGVEVSFEVSPEGTTLATV